MTATLLAPPDEDLRTRLVAACAGVRVDTAAGTLARYAYDASSYRVAPLAVAFPADVREMQQLLRACADLAVPVTVRGGGTSMAGNAIGEGLVIDTSRSLRRVLSVDAEARTATVEAGVVLDDLARELRPHGLAFAPDPSSKSRATIGGMLGNDACGNHSVRWGRTSSHVVEVEVLLSDGTHLRVADGVTAVDPDDAAAARRAAELEAELRALARENLAILRTELGRIGRQVSGFHLDELLPERGFDVARALVGSEGTCAVVVTATVRLVEPPAATSLLVLGYADVVDAATDVPLILPFEPTATEGIDDAIVATMLARRGPDSVAALPQGRAWLYVELDGPTQAAVQARTEELLTALRAAGRLVEGLVVDDPAQRASLWRVREDGAGLSTRPDTTTQTWAGWEDAAVDPSRLADYLRDFRALTAEHGLTGVLYGHFGAGCVHVRLDFDLASDAGRAQLVAFVRAAADLVVRHGGSLSGEHGDGRARSELLGRMYSPQMLALFGRFRAAFDPLGLLNPGIIVDPRPVGADLLPVASDEAVGADGRPLLFAYPHDRGFASAVQRCVGVGRCRSDHGGFMCPSFRATQDEKDSTRGRARVLQDMVNGSLGPDAWASDAVHEALDLCLSCKACSSDCPVGVDMATYKSEVLQQTYHRRLRPVSHYSLGWLPRWIALAGRVPALVNAVLAVRPLRLLAVRLGGVTPHRRLPRFAAARRARLARSDASPDLLLLVDSFTRGFRPTLVQHAETVLRASGARVGATPSVCCALTWTTTGQLTAARRILHRTARLLDRTGDAPIVVLEPSCAAALRKDLPELVPTAQARRVAERVTTFAAAVDARLDAGWEPPPLPASVLTQTHCHQHAVFGATSSTGVMRRLGMRTDDVEGCCGLAGNFGFEAEHYATSMAVAGHDLVPKVEALGDGVAVADGFSCQTQIAHVSGETVQARHLADVLHAALTEHQLQEGAS
ncbi:FAD-binding and (Fe-S)-binding domain-containing protein [Aeromicrobium sp.]|uniref:FAD-binding and (Fe-S)-binding domain-containing protein n=1 Tax=Aeromicrobium sp. TaxID=1871063 RepID=UPI0035155153